MSEAAMTIGAFTWFIILGHIILQIWRLWYK